MLENEYKENQLDTSVVFDKTMLGLSPVVKVVIREDGINPSIEVDTFIINLGVSNC